MVSGNPTLAEKLAVLLVQLAPSLEFELETAGAFFAELRCRAAIAIVCEPRHPSWFDSPAEDLMRSHKVSRAAADPALCEAAARPGGWPVLSYCRLHGSPAMYRSSYADRLEQYAQRLEQSALQAETWCIFDNTASSAAMTDALALQELLRRNAGVLVEQDNHEKQSSE